MGLGRAPRSKRGKYVVKTQERDHLAPFTLHKKMGPDLLKSGPDQFFLTVYTDNNQVRLMTEKSPNAHCLHC